MNDVDAIDAACSAAQGWFRKADTRGRRGGRALG